MFDLRGTKAASGFELIPNGTYMARVTAAEVKDTKAGTGKYIKATITIVGGEYDNRKIWQMFNVENPNPVAVEIGMQQLKSMMLASGLSEEKCVIKNVTDLEGMTFGIVTGIKEDQNVVKQFKAFAGDTLTPVGKAAKAAMASAAKNMIPW